MKKLLAIIVLSLFLTTTSWSDDVQDYQLEGMSIGDSFLNYISAELLIKELNNKYTIWYHNKKFASVYGKNVKNLKCIKM